MTDLLGNAARWLDQKRHAHLTTPVVYVRRDGTSIDVNATIGRTDFNVEDDRGFLRRVESRDFLIRAADLGNIEPERGDRIDDDGTIYEVNAFAGGPHWRYEGPQRLTYRVHTKAVDW